MLLLWFDFYLLFTIGFIQKANCEGQECLLEIDIFYKRSAYTASFALCADISVYPKQKQKNQTEEL